jgi:paraquat-inducible protein B
MYEGSRGSVLEDVPTAVAVSKRRRPPQLVWLIPIVAALIGGWLAVKTYLDKGPEITITFKTAEGLEAGKTKIKYKDVDVGDVRTIHVSKDLSNVVVTAELVKSSENFLVDDTRFWVVRPRVGGGQVSGLGTLFSGAYIGVDIGHSTKKRREFTGLETQPIITGDVPGRQFILHSADLSVDVGAPVFFRRTLVGRVVVHEVDQDGKGVTIKVFVNEPYDKQVNANTRFWDASGIDVTLDASGVKVNTQSIVSILIGGLAFETPSDSGALPEAEENTLFPLHSSRADAMKRPDQETLLFTMYFPDSLRGLTAGSPVEINGVTVGEVKSIRIEYREESNSAKFPVEVALYPGRLRAMFRGGGAAAPTPAEQKARFEGVVETGFRAQIRTGSLLTGQLYIALDNFPNAAPAKIDWTKNPPVFPTEPGTMKELQATLTNLSKKLENMPIEQISGDLRQALQSMNRTLVSADQAVKRLDKEVSPAAKATLEDARRMLNTADRTLASDAPLQQDLRTSLRELTRAAQSLRELTDLLERQPESLIRGKKESSR